MLLESQLRDLRGWIIICDDQGAIADKFAYLQQIHAEEMQRIMSDFEQHMQTLHLVGSVCRLPSRACAEDF